VRVGVPSTDLPPRHDHHLRAATVNDRRLRVLAAEWTATNARNRRPIALEARKQRSLAMREPHKGAVVKSLTMTELVQTYEVRILLEVDAARHGAPAVTDDDCRAMRATSDRLVHAFDDGRIVDALNDDEEMLSILYTASRNHVLLESIRGLWQRCRAYKIRGARRAREMSERTLWSFQPRHVAAAQKRDGALAAKITRESLRYSLDTIGTTFAAAP
jgi:DNA-binding GntR family transcriptional regulator